MLNYGNNWNWVKYDWKWFVKFYFIILKLERYFRTFKIELKVNLWKLNILIFKSTSENSQFFEQSQNWTKPVSLDP